MAKQLHSVQPKKDKKVLSFKVVTDLSKIPNKLHLDAQINYPARVHEDKRFKRPKHKGKVFDD
jgi:hypothetical protein